MEEKEQNKTESESFGMVSGGGRTDLGGHQGTHHSHHHQKLDDRPIGKTPKKLAQDMPMSWRGTRHSRRSGQKQQAKVLQLIWLLPLGTKPRQSPRDEFILSLGVIAGEWKVPVEALLLKLVTKGERPQLVRPQGHQR